MPPLEVYLLSLALVIGGVACAGGGGTSSSTGTTATASGAATVASPASSSGLAVAPGFAVATVASVAQARELAFLPNGDLLVGTGGTTIVIIPQADVAGNAGAPQTFYTASEGPAAGIAVGAGGTIYFGTPHGVWRLPHHAGDQSEPAASALRIGSVRTATSREDHVTTSVAVSPTAVYAAVGSSSNDLWPEIDATRATIQRIPLGTSAMTTRATQVRNGIGLAIDPASGHLWVAGAGQDNLAFGHPYEYADDVDAHPGVVNYGWPFCEENHVVYRAGMDCARQAVPLIEFPAYATHIGLAFYPTGAAGQFAFPAAYRGGLFVTSHGSWHCCPATLPNVAFVPMHGDVPATAVHWNNPNAQWQTFLSAPDDSAGNTSYSMRPTGIAVGPNGSLFVADDGRGAVYRIRPR